MVLFELWRFEHFTTIFTRIPFPFMSSHVHLKTVTVIVTFSTNATEVRVFPCVVLNVSIESRFRIECFVTFIAPPYFQFGPPAGFLLQISSQLFGFLIFELHKQNKCRFNEAAMSVLLNYNEISISILYYFTFCPYNLAKMKQIF